LIFSLGLVAQIYGPHTAHAAGAAPAAKRSPEGTDAPTLRLPKLATPQRYAAELVLVPSEETFAGKIAIELMVAAPTKVLWLNMGPELKIQRVQIRPGAGLGGRGADGGAGQQAGGPSALGGRAQPSGQHFVALRFERPVPAGRAVLNLEYQGKLLMSEEAGLYREKVGDDTYIYSDFEPVDARRAFPCFDEPSYKVPWQLVLHVKREHVALSNTPPESETDEPGGMKRVVFRETAPLPSYLVALAVGPFGIVDAGKAGQKQTPIRIITLRGHEAEARYAAQSSGPILAQLEQYLGIPYPYEKIDQIAVPGKGGAMENPGLITYGERIIQIRPEAETVPARRRFARVCAHELAHQWTGNLVTLSFWDDLWLNESLASFLESKIIGRWQPGWQEPLDRVSSRQGALSADSLLSARRIRQPIESHDDIVNAFDAITYAKGRAVLEMFETFMGEDIFQRGLARYLREHAHQSGTAQDLIASWQTELQSAPAPTAPTPPAGAKGPVPSGGPGTSDAQNKARQLPEAIASLLDQPGAPLLSLKLSCEGGQARLLVTQQRYLLLGARPEGKQPVYQVPLCARYRVGDQPPQQACVLFDAPELQWTLPGISVCPDYVVANANATGYYRVRYDAPLLEQLVQRGVRPVEPLLSTAERVSLIGDLAALTRSGHVPADKALAVAVQAARDPSWQVLSASLGLVMKLRDAVPDALWPNWRRLLDKTYSQRLRSVGLRLRAEDDEDTRILRLVLMNAVIGEAKEPQLYAESLALVRRWLNDRTALEPEVAQHLVPLVARHGDRALFDELLGAARREKDATVRGVLLSGLGSFEDQALARAALNIVLGDEFPMAEAQRLLYGPLGQPATRRLPFLFVKEHFDALVGRLPREGGARLAAVGSALCTDAERTEVESFFTGRSTRYTGGPRILKQSLERIGTCTAFTAAQQGPLADFLRRY
jgi:alanyl aminopeptidase